MGMASLRRLLHTGRAGNAADTDWWYLVFDADAARFRVVHEWGNADAQRLGKVTGGTVELEIEAFLSRRGDPGQRELIRLLQKIFTIDPKS